MFSYKLHSVSITIFPAWDLITAVVDKVHELLTSGVCERYLVGQLYESQMRYDKIHESKHHFAKL